MTEKKTETNVEKKTESTETTRGHVLLIDGQPMAFRSYYTIPTTWAVRGKPVNALFGYARLLLRLLKDFGAPGVPGASGEAARGVPVSHVAVLLDPPGKTFRHALSDSYKTNRPVLPDDFKEQLAQLPEATEAFNVSTMRQPNFEADDLIATYATAAERDGHLVTIVSSDKDLMQLVSERVTLYDPVKKESFDIDAVLKRYGVLPSQMVDVQALAGDTVDNVQGVPGIGMKTAASLIAQFGSLDALYERIDEVKHVARRKALLEHRESANIARQLVALHRTAPMPQALDALQYQFHLRRFIEYLERFNFRSTISAVLKDVANDREARERASGAIGAVPVDSAPLPPILLREAALFVPAADKASPAGSSAQLPPADAVAAAGATVSAIADAIASAVVPAAAVGGESAATATEAAVAVVADGLRELSDDEMRAQAPAGVTLVRDVATARRVVAQLRTLTHYADGRRRMHACDTEAIGVDLKEEGPVGKGLVICFSIYCGPDVDFGSGSKLFVDTLGSRAHLLEEFRAYFEDENVWKVWHNYGFDRHAIGNHGIDVRGFGGDTMHMARLWDASRMFGKGGYSLEGLTRDLLQRGKTSMKDIFGAPKVRVDGTEGAEVVMPALDYLQRSLLHVGNWIDYSTYDSESTWLLRDALELRLRHMPWRWPDDEIGDSDERLWRWRGGAESTWTAKDASELTMYDMYRDHWRPYGELLTSMERHGIWLDAERLAAITPVAWHDRDEQRLRFIEFMRRYCPGAAHMNIDSDVQRRQLFFAPCNNAKDKTQQLPAEKEFKRLNVERETTGASGRVLKHATFTLTGFGLPPLEFCDSGWPRAGASVLRKLAGDVNAGQYGKAYRPFAALHGDEEAAAFCEAIDALCESQAVSTLLSTFIEPLQGMIDARGRLHTSININTETGRLSSRRPNLQNQPALEKDRYKVRHCFAAEPGNMLIVADYGQLELRLLAHMSRCRSMIDAFRTGGDFHSRTALGMYPNIAKDVETGACLLEWDASKGAAPAPLLKDKYSTERRRAKTLNFSIAYGKTARGLAIDWETSVAEAKETLERWYADRPEVRDWQEETVRRARLTGYTKTLMGRLRVLPGITSAKRGEASHMARAAINTPLQGGAADIVMAAMLRIEHDALLRKLGFRQLLQVHDELILEGPKEAVDEALARVVQLMSRPIDRDLLVELVVDAKYARTWGEAK
jgi:DNA polymerase I